jgi:hypothetical protein
MIITMNCSCAGGGVHIEGLLLAMTISKDTVELDNEYVDLKPEGELQLHSLAVMVYGGGISSVGYYAV